MHATKAAEGIHTIKITLKKNASRKLTKNATDNMLPNLH